jgi:hypothetical protein
LPPSRAGVREVVPGTFRTRAFERFGKGRADTSTQSLTERLIVLALAGAGAIIGATAVEYWHRAHPAAAPDSSRNTDIAALVVEIARLKELVPSQSHTMSDVGYHWANLWFAAEHRNWPLASFYLDETRQHIRWTILIRPIRKDADGHPVDLKNIFEGIDTGVMTAVADAIARKDYSRFVESYKQGLEACYACHKASGKPYLRPMIPERPGSPIINVNGAATWPP